MTIPKSNHGAAVTSAANQSFSDISTILSGFKYYFTYRGGDGNDYISIGGDSDDQIWGGGGDDFLWSGGGNDQLWGGTGNDILGGGDGDDELWGEDGDDFLQGGAGADRLSGGAGVDWLFYNGSDQGVTVDLGEGTVRGGHAEGDVIVDFENVLGSDYGDVLKGDDGANRLEGDNGDDVLEGGAGADRLNGGLGADTVSYSGSDEAVTVDLEAGTVAGGHAEGDVIMDVEDIIGSKYGDRLIGDEGVNRLEGGAGADQLDGGLGTDTVSYSGSDEAVTVDLEAGTGEGGHAEGDTIANVEIMQGSDYGDVLRGDGGVNTLLGGGGNDRLSGRGGDDLLEGGAGADRLDGGAGVDWAVYWRSDEAVTVDLGEGTGKGGYAEGDVIMNVEVVLGSGYGDVLVGDDSDNQLNGGNGDDVLEGGAGADRLNGDSEVDTVSYAGSNRGVIVYLSEGTGKRGHAEGDVIRDVENVLGSNYGDVLGGDASANRLDGGGGNDRLSGRGGDDVLEGGVGADRLIGGAGEDTVSYAGSDRGVRVYLETGAGKGGHAEGDVIAQVESVLGSNYGDVLGGDASANRLDGGGGNDRLSGKGGDDVLEGGVGADRLIGGSGDDTVSYTGSDRGVRVYLETGTGKGGHAEGDVIAQVESVLGSNYGDVLGGDNGANRLSGGGGNDRLSGRGGDDVLEGGAGADRLIGGSGMDTVSYSGSDEAVRVDLGDGTGEGGHAEGDVIAQVENVLGSNYGDLLMGNNGANSLNGGGGNDRLSGGGGDDVFSFDFGHGDDIIIDFTDGDDLIDLSAFGLAGFDELVVSSDSDGVTIDLGANGGGTILLEGFDIADLDAGDFLFS